MDTSICVAYINAIEEATAKWFSHCFKYLDSKGVLTTKVSEGEGHLIYETSWYFKDCNTDTPDFTTYHEIRKDMTYTDVVSVALDIVSSIAAALEDIELYRILKVVRSLGDVSYFNVTCPLTFAVSGPKEELIMIEVGTRGEEISEFWIKGTNTALGELKLNTSINIYDTDAVVDLTTKLSGLKTLLGI